MYIDLDCSSMAVHGQEGARRAAVIVDTEHVLHPKNGSVIHSLKTEEEGELVKEELHDASPLYPPHKRPTQVQHHEGIVGEQCAVQDSACVESLFVVIKTEPEEINASAQSGEDHRIAQDCGYEEENEDHQSLHEIKEVPSSVVIKTEPDLQRLKCESESENHHIPQQGEPYLPPLCKTEADTVEVSYPLYSGAGEQTCIQMWSVQHVDCKQIPELMGDQEDSNTSQPSSNNGSRSPAGRQILDKKITREGKHGKHVHRLDKPGKEHSRLKSYSCSECGSTFSKSSAFYSHMRIHTGKRLYQCSQCDKSFTQSRSFKTHQRTHTGEKPYQCAQCGKTFTRTDVLQIHQRTHTGEKPYLCSQCGKSFTRLDVYQNHRRIHTGEKPYQCSQCAKTFTRLDVYQNHQRIHTGEKPYQCSVCGRRFLYLSNIRNHERTHTEERPYRCSLCDKTFIQSGHLTKHLRTHTGEKT
ncbi:zinc finger and SCAN domain-containing protein 2-like [Colossoma macropomum]|uniref:zinc finger and SCAN domain-containing protein 2-like n=1 Tax=Colossoma macropomum TaxID=42526 RepID=UPI0018640211|nr:zinc finger and SCAN domain-containing protein 2-like [Colossoma macropomum]